MKTRTFSLAESYRWSADLTRRTARNFIYSFQVLPRQQRRAMDTLYAFMRVTDDLSDEDGELSAKERALDEWSEQLHAMTRSVYAHPVHPALHDAVLRFGIPVRYLELVIEGVRQDLKPVRLANFEELYAYCYRVASVVGLCCIEIWGYTDPQAREYAEASGVAFQLTNILRDLKEDFGRDRVYLPREEWERFASPPEGWANERLGEAFQSLMRFQAERAHHYYDQGERLLPLLRPPGRAVFRVMLGIYRGLLREIERKKFDVFGERVRLSQWKKLSMLAWAFPVRWGWL